MVRLAWFLCLAVFSAQCTTKQKTKKAVFVIVDGVAADVIEKLDPPNFRKISNEGGFAHAIVGGEKDGYSQTPTISAVGYNSVLTGTWVNKHNVWDNDIAQPNYNYPTIFRLLKQQSPHKTIGIFSSWLDNRTKLVGDKLPQTGNIAIDYKFDGLELDTARFPHDEQRDFMHRIDEEVATHAANTIRDKAPDLSWVYLEYPDDMGHMHGDSPEFYKAVDYADRQVGQIWESIRYREQNFNEEWLVIVTTDHGRDSITGHNHGGQSNRERAGWILTNAKNLSEHFKNNRSSIVDIMPTIARFMDIHIPVDINRELDGIPLTQPLSISGLTAAADGQKLKMEWKAHESSGKVKIWLATANNFKGGGRDEYHYMGEYPLSTQSAIIEVVKFPSKFYKVVVEADHNTVGRWVINETN